MGYAGSDTGSYPQSVPVAIKILIAGGFVGRITIRSDLVVYLFGTPGHRRFWFMWE